VNLSVKVFRRQTFDEELECPTAGSSSFLPTTEHYTAEITLPQTRYDGDG